MSLPRTYAVMLALLLLVIACSLAFGAAELDGELSGTLLSLRTTRLFAAMLSGAALATAGVIVQGLFHNPLADPSILGATAGASLGGRIAMLSFQAFASTGVAQTVAPEMLLPVGCILGAGLSLLVLLAVHRAGDDMLVLLLVGFLLSSLLVSVGSFVTSLALERWELARAMMDFTLGDVSGVGPRRIALATPLVLAGFLAALAWARPLDVMLSGELEAASLGIDVRELRRACALWTAVLCAAAVALGGNVGFVGLVVPHILRPRLGASHRRLIPAAALLGAIFVAACDVIARVLPTRAEVPLGVVTGLLGAPVFLVLLLRSRRELLRG